MHFLHMRRKKFAVTSRCAITLCGLWLSAFSVGGKAPVAVAQDNPQVKFHAAPKPLPAGAVTSDWISFLGPHHNLVSDETRLSHEFPPAGPPMVWEMEKGSGYSAPAIRGDRLILLHRVEDEEVIDCLEPASGKRYWRFAYPTTYVDRYGYNDGPRSSPVITPDGASVFTLGAGGLLHCLELSNGRVRWKRDLPADFKLRPDFFGWGTSPLVYEDKLIVNIGARNGPCVAAFDVQTGAAAWTAAHEGWGASYASPVPANFHGQARVLVFAGGESNPPTGGLLCINPATGQVDFAFPWRGTRRESVNASSPLVVGNHVFVSESYGSGGAMLEILPPAADGKLSFKTAWTNPNFGTHFMSAVARDGHLYGVDGHGPQDAFLVCVDAASGKEIWRTQPEWKEQFVSPAGDARDAIMGTYRAWLMPVDGAVLCQGEFGHLLWIGLTPKGFKEIARTTLFRAGETWTPPVVSRGLLYICQNSPSSGGGRTRLICYDLRGGITK